MEAYQKLQKIFNGLTRAQFSTRETKESGKVGGKAYIIKKKSQKNTLEDHIEGVDRLGIILIRDDSTCIWSCIDVDDYQQMSVRLFRHITN